MQQNYFSDLYPAKMLDLSAKPFFPCDGLNKIIFKSASKFLDTSADILNRSFHI